MSARLVAAVVLLAASLPARAQESAPTCFDSIPATEMHSRAVHLMAVHRDPRTAAGKPLRASVDRFASTVAVTMRRLLGERGDELPRGDRIGWRALEGRVRVVAYRDGRLAARIVTDTTPEPWEVGRAGIDLLARAVDSARAAGLRFEWSDADGADSLTFALILQPDVPGRDGVGHQPPPGGVPVFTLAMPWREGVTASQAFRPVYPPEARSDGVEAAIRVSFLVNADGSVAVGTIRQRGITGARSGTGVSYERDFFTAVVNALARKRFEPARLGGCAVTQLVQQHFNFLLASGNSTARPRARPR